jgi:response regulator NasT
MSEPQAFRWIQKTSMDRRLTMRTVAEAIIEGTMGTDATGNTGDTGKAADAEKAE